MQVCPEPKPRLLSFANSYLNTGLALQVTHMNNPHGYVSLLQREKLQHVPTGVQDLMKLLTLLKNVSQMKVSSFNTPLRKLSYKSRSKL